MGELIIFEPWRERLSFFPTELHFSMYDYIRILFIFQRLICWVLFFLTPTNMNLAVYGNGLAVEVINDVDPWCCIQWASQSQIHEFILRKRLEIQTDGTQNVLSYRLERASGVGQFANFMSPEKSQVFPLWCWKV